MELLKVNRIIPFSSVDGPGNRTAVFLQGCNADCKYCHNPETRNICNNCGDCVSVCKTGALRFDEHKERVLFDDSLCVKCDSCIKTCRFGSSPRILYLSPEEAEERIRRQIPYIRGVTVSGGECMLYPKLLAELFALCRRDSLSTLIDTNGTIPFSGKDELLEVTDGVMLDIKAFSEDDFWNVTGVSGKNVLSNAMYLSEIGKLYEVRCVIAPSLYDVKKSVRQTGEFLKKAYSNSHFRIKLISYRPVGVRQEYKNMLAPDRNLLLDLKNNLLDMGYEDIVIT